jgi:hypothetical protein
MRIIRVTALIGMLLALAIACCAQMEQRATADVQQGPVVRSGLPASADVLINGLFALRIPAPAGGMSPMERARIVAARLNQAFEQGMSWEDMRVSQIGGLWSVAIDSTLIATADVRSAQAYHMQTGALASRWARQTVVALGGKPSMIAMQLQPIPTKVAGARAELPMSWAVSPTKTLPLLDASNGNRLGDVTVGGPSNRLESVNAVAMFEYTQDDTIIRVFVPISGASITDQLMRVNGVGLVSIAPAMMTIPRLLTGDAVMQTANQMSSQWNSLINSRLAERNLLSLASTKVVPLYSMDDGQAIGAAQIVGPASSIANTQAVIMSAGDILMQFRATSTAVPSMEMPPTMDNVVISALIYMVNPASAPAVTPDTTPVVPE